MNETETHLQKLKKREALQHALYRWVAAIREALLRELLRQHNNPLAAPGMEIKLEIVRRDLNQCERLLTSFAIDEDPVLEIWRKELGRAGVLWFNFAPPDSEES